MTTTDSPLARINARDNLRTPAQMALPMTTEQKLAEAKRLLAIGGQVGKANDRLIDFCNANGLQLTQDKDGNTIAVMKESA